MTYTGLVATTTGLLPPLDIEMEARHPFNVVEGVDLAAAKEAAMKDSFFQELITDEPNRLVVLNAGDHGGYTFWINKTLGDQTLTLTNDKRGWAVQTPEYLAWTLKMANTLRLDDSTK